MRPDPLAWLFSSPSAIVAGFVLAWWVCFQPFLAVRLLNVQTFNPVET